MASPCLLLLFLLLFLGIQFKALQIDILDFDELFVHLQKAPKNLLIASFSLCPSLQSSNLKWNGLNIWIEKNWSFFLAFVLCRIISLHLCERLNGTRKNSKQTSCKWLYWRFFSTSCADKNKKSLIDFGRLLPWNVTFMATYLILSIPHAYL